MIASAEPEIWTDYGYCTWHESEGKREFILPCVESPNVYWDLTTAGTFNWEVPRWNKTGDEHREGDEYIHGFKEFQPIGTPGPPPAGVRLYANGNTLRCVFPDGTDWQIAPYPYSIWGGYNGW